MLYSTLLYSCVVAVVQQFNTCLCGSCCKACYDIRMWQLLYSNLICLCLVAVVQHVIALHMIAAVLHHAITCLWQLMYSKFYIHIVYVVYHVFTSCVITVVQSVINCMCGNCRTVCYYLYMWQVLDSLLLHSYIQMQLQYSILLHPCVIAVVLHVVTCMSGSCCTHVIYIHMYQLLHSMLLTLVCGSCQTVFYSLCAWQLLDIMLVKFFRYLDIDKS